MQGRPGEQNGRRPTLINGSAAGHAAVEFTASHLAKWLELFRAKRDYIFSFIIFHQLLPRLGECETLGVGFY
jgi:hypothetical protein